MGLCPRLPPAHPVRGGRAGQRLQLPGRRRAGPQPGGGSDALGGGQQAGAGGGHGPPAEPAGGRVPPR